MSSNSFEMLFLEDFFTLYEESKEDWIDMFTWKMFERTLLQPIFDANKNLQL